MSETATSEAASLLAAYLDAAGDLKRFFASRLRSMTAAEDLLQDLYVKVAAWPPRAEVGNASSLLYRMANNLMLDRLRAEGRAATREAAWLRINTTFVGVEPVDEAASADRVAYGRQRIARLGDAIRALPPQTRQAFSLHKLHGLSHAETAQRLGVSQKTVEKQVSAALLRLTAMMAEADRPPADMGGSSPPGRLTAEGRKRND